MCLFMRYDIIALDLDGTALNPQNQVSPAVREAVGWARSHGVHVVISTKSEAKRS